MSSRYTPILTHSHQASLIKVLGRMIKLGEADEQLVGAYEAIVNAKEGIPPQILVGCRRMKRLGNRRGRLVFAR